MAVNKALNTVMPDTAVVKTVMFNTIMFNIWEGR
jgi:hypothetical protein